MALFHKKDKKDKKLEAEKENAVKYFEPLIVDTQNAYEDLSSIANSSGVSPRYLDFKIIDFTTQYKIEDEKKEPNVNDKKENSEKKSDEKQEENIEELDEWIVLEKEELSKFNDDKFFLNRGLKIRQQFKVEFFDIRKKTNSISIPKIKLVGNKNLTKVFVTIKKNLDLNIKENFEDALIEDINKKKMKFGILVGIRCGNLRREVSKTVSSIRINGYIENDITFPVMLGLSPVKPINDELIFHYRKNIQAEDEKGRIDYARRGYLSAVSEGDVVIERIKAKEGQAGRNCKGEYIRVEEPKEKKEITINHTENIEKQEDDNCIKYISLKSGYVKEEKGVYDIQEEMELSEVSFKSTGSIEAGIDKNVIINVKESDVFKDAIGSGMVIETGEINVQGNVGQSTKIKAKKVNIGGQTHSTSYIKADKAILNVHLGEIDAYEVEVQRLEGGLIKANIARIKSVLGGTVMAKEIYIDVLVSNSNVIGSDFIEIRQVKGTGNKVRIDPSQIKGIDDETEAIKEKLQKVRKKLKDIPKLMDSKKLIIDKNRQSIEMIKAKILELKKSGTTPPNTFMMKLREYQQLVNEYNGLLQDFEETKFMLTDLQEDLNNIQDKVTSSKIINKGSWKEYNEISFKLIDPPEELVYVTKEGEITREFTIKNVGDGEEDRYVINRSSEISQ